MQIIQEVKIRKFRSIRSITNNFKLGDLTILVGKNDQGKSNILRSLNLFFNNQTDIGQSLRFTDDFCYTASSGKGNNIEIRIDLIINPPKNRFKNAEKICWSKQWKRDGSVIESRVFVESGNELPKKDNIYKWLDKLKYRYVPAIKGRDYFNTLMGELHDVLDSSNSNLMEKQGKGFISGIEKVTKQITQELNSQLGIPNTIQVPSDFKQLFSNLDFGTTKDNKTYHLQQRGDGIKVRHIPIILKYMADQEKNISIPGYVKPDTIWGFEEPENNLEMKYAFELAETIKKYTKDIQILATTHSPAFYGLETTQNCQINKYYVSQDSTNSTFISLIEENQKDFINTEMGILPLITPYLKELIFAQNQIKELEKKIDSSKPKTKYFVITEDSKVDLLKTLLLANDIELNKTEFISYEGKDKISAAKVISKYLKTKFPEAKTIIHRDRDYLSDHDVESIKQSIIKINSYPLIPEGVDIESYYINSNHIKKLYPKLNLSQIDESIKKATADAYEDSIGRFINHTLGNQKPEKNDYASQYKKILSDYNSNQERYRYGKKVLGLTKASLQKIIKENIEINKVSDQLKINTLIDFVKQQ